MKLEPDEFDAEEAAFLLSATHYLAAARSLHKNCAMGLTDEREIHIATFRLERPINQLYGQTVELLLKACLARTKVSAGNSHDLKSLLMKALSTGLAVKEDTIEAIEEISMDYMCHKYRYVKFGRPWTIQEPAIWDDACSDLMETLASKETVAKL